MKNTERQRFLLAKANKDNFVSIPDSARELNVSVETIRRDVNILCEQKKLKKVHGGAVPIHAAILKDPSFAQGVFNTTLNFVFVKKLMGQAAVSVLVADSEKLGRTSTYRFAQPTDFDHIFVDDQRPVPQDFLDALEGSDTKLTIVEA